MHCCCGDKAGVDEQPDEKDEKKNKKDTNKELKDEMIWWIFFFLFRKFIVTIINA